MTTNPYRDWHKELLEAGWTHDLTATTHHRYRPPPGVKSKPVIWPSTPGRGRAYANTAASVKRALAATQEARADG